MLRRSTSFDTSPVPMKIAMSRPMAFIVARPRSLITFRSWPAVRRLIRNDAAISTTAKSTRLYGTRSRTDSLNTASGDLADGARGS